MGCCVVQPRTIYIFSAQAVMTSDPGHSRSHWRIQPFTKGGAKTGQCRRDTGPPGLHRESSFQKAAFWPSLT